VFRSRSTADAECMLTFTSTSIAGKKMIVQATNTGGDLSEGQFDLAIPGGGVGLCKHQSTAYKLDAHLLISLVTVNSCTNERGAPSSGWGAQYGGISSNTCDSFPSALQPGCEWRFGDFFKDADNPTIDYKQVTCPKVLTDKTGCVRDGETPTGGDSSSGGNGSPEPSDAPAPSSASSPAEPTTSSAAAPVTTSVAAPVSSAPASPSVPAAESSNYGTSSSEAAPASSSLPAEPHQSCEVEYLYE